MAIIQFLIKLIAHSKKTLLTFLVFTSTLSYGFAQDKLNAVKEESILINELKDVYRGFYIHHVIEEQKELIDVYVNKDESGLDNAITTYIKTCNGLKAYNFYDKTLNALVKDYLNSTVQNYTILKNKGVNSSVFKQDYEKHKKVKNKYIDYLYSTYSIDHFINMTAEEYWKKIDKNNYIKSKDYPRYQNLKKKNMKAGLHLLDSITKKTTNFQEYSIYQIELADQYEKNRHSLGENASEIAITKYKSILDQNKFSIYLYEAWLKWRTVTQHSMYGFSKTSEIPNATYNSQREQVALTILKYIAKNPKNEMAINEFLVIATHDIVRRFGDFQYGNQNILEYRQFF